MAMWNQGVDLLRDAMFFYAQLSNGNLAHGIMIVTCLMRLLLLPLAIRLARSAAVQQELMRRLRPELDAIRERFKHDQRRLAEETRRVFAREGASMLPTAGCLGAVLQAPVLLALFDAVRQCAAVGGRFLWIRDIAKPDVLLAVIVAALTSASMFAGPQLDSGQQTRLLMIVLPAVMTLVALWHMAAGVGLYWGVSSAMGVVQGMAVRRSLAGRIA